MTIWREEKPVPTNLPAARLYFEDIEEIVSILSILLRAGEKKEAERVEFRIGKELCDNVQDLRKMARRTTNLQVTVVGASHYALFGIYRTMTLWTTNLSGEEAWSAFRRLEALFETRKLRWVSLLHRSRGMFFVSGLIQGVAAGILIGLPISLHRGPRHPLSPVVIVGLIITALLVVLVITMGMLHHTVAILRNSWEHAAAREELRTKIVAGVIPALIGALFGIGGALLAVYLRHKYWP
jgi:hypothetical protein